MRPWESTHLTAPGKPRITVTATPCRHGPPLSRPVAGPVVGFALRWDTQDHGVFWITGDTVLFRGLREVPRLSEEESRAAYDRYAIPAPGSWVWAYGPLANFAPGKQETWVDFHNESRAPLLFIAGGADHIMPPSVNRSNAQHYKAAGTVTEYREFPGRSHWTRAEPGWEQIADAALDWAAGAVRDHP